MSAGQILIFIGLLVAITSVTVGRRLVTERGGSVLPVITLIIGLVLIVVGDALR